jgi:FkbM family methyltransferase
MVVSPRRDPAFADHPAHGELAQHRFFKDVLPFCTQRRTAIDVGAHIGLWTRMLLQKFEYIVAFEPVAENFACLLQNVLSKKARLENAALGSCQEFCTMTMPEKGNSGCWHVKPEGKDTQITTLDSYLLRDVDLIKIDAEGYEGRVISGAVTTIMQSRPTIVFEDNGLGQKYYGINWLDPKAMLLQMGYRQALRIRKDEIWTPV